ncbi:MAG: deoxyribose-phosphate aldolase [Lachnospiraceae bacterium]|nr:deoxyribose-phosphate aldolase [Lachnospiraceae bacterium]
MAKAKKLNELDLSREGLAKMIDHSVLNTDSQKKDVDECIAKAIKYGFKGCHTNPYWSPYVQEQLKGTGIECSWTTSFPMGATATENKINEAKLGVKLLSGGPWVMDMVANVGALKDGQYDYYKNEIAEITKIVHDGGAECKVIIEAQLLTDDEIRAACDLIAEAGADWVKSSTGRAGGPNLNVVKTLCEAAPDPLRVKVAGTGSFWTPMVVLGCLLCGVERIGTRSGDKIVDELCDVVVPMLF